MRRGRTWKTVLKALCAVSLSAALLFGGCGSQDPAAVSENSFRVYYLEADGLGIAPAGVSFQTIGVEAGGPGSEDIGRILALFGSDGPSADLKALLPEAVKIESYRFDGQNLTLDFSQDYLKMEKTREVLARAGIVRTMVQLADVRTVAFTVNGNPLMTGSGTEMGRMTAESFIENTGRQINSYSHAEITLYFAGADGQSLQREMRSIYYSSNKPLELAIVERLMEGPRLTGNTATIPAGTQIIGVSISDKICYVNLSEGFLLAQGAVTDEVKVYSIVNSLIANCDISQVQIAVNGETNVTLSDSVTLDQLYEMNLDLVVNAS